MKKIFATAWLAIIVTWLCSSTFAATSRQSNDLIQWGYDNNITKYATQDTFMGNTPITREQAAKMIWTRITSQRSLEIPMSVDACTFSDSNEIDSSLTDRVGISCNYGLFRWYKGKFMPKEYLTLEDIITVWERLAEQNSIINEYAKTVKLPSEDRLLLRWELLEALYTLNKYAQEKHDISVKDALTKTQETLNIQKKIWDAQKINSYTVTQTLSCFCMKDYIRPIKYNIVDNIIVTWSAIYADDGTGKVIIENAPTLHTINEAFDIIQEAINQKAERINIEYDTNLGYPTSIAIDISSMIADEERYYTFIVNNVTTKQ